MKWLETTCMTGLGLAITLAGATFAQSAPQKDTMACVAGLRDKLQTEPRQGPPPMEARPSEQSAGGEPPVQL